MKRTPRAEPILFTGSGGSLVVFRIVRDIREWQGLTVGIVRNGRGAEFVVKRNAVANRWDALQGISVTDIRSVVTR